MKYLSAIGDWIMAHRLLSIGIGLSVLLIVFVVLLIWLIRKRKNPGPAPTLHKSQLVNLWKRFLRQVPARVRKSVERYPVYLVMGDANCGKSQLIETCTGWKGQARQFLPSQTEDPLLQIYQGGHELVIEQSSVLLEDVTPNARTALKRLWRRVFAQREPRVLVCLKASDLATNSPEDTQRLAQTFRGKLNLLAELKKQPVQVSIVLTHMDHFQGYPDLAAFLHAHGLPLAVDVSETEGARLDQVEPYLPRMLTEVDAGAYKRVLDLLQNTPDLFGDVQRFVKVLTEPQPLSMAPKVDRIHLTSATVEPGVDHPFADEPPPLRTEDVERRRMLHRIAATALVLIAVSAIALGAANESMLYNRAKTAVENLEATADLARAPEAEAQILAFQQREEHNPLLGYLPGFMEEADGYLQGEFARVSAKLRAQTVEHLREQHLLPAVDRCIRSERPQEKTLYCLAIIYAAQGNSLGERILEDVYPYEEATGVPSTVIRRYIEYSDQTFAGGVDLGELPDQFLEGYERTEQPWLVYLTELTRTLEEQVLLDNRLRVLREKTVPILAAIDELKHFTQIEGIFEDLEQESSLNLRRIFGGLMLRMEIPDWINQNYQALEDLLLVVQEQDLEIPEVNVTFGDFLARLEILKDSQERNPTSYKLTLGEKVFRFDMQKWEDLIWRSEITKFVQTFIDTKQRAKHAMFFRSRTEYADVALNPYNDGSYLFTGRAHIEGWYTRPAFEKEVLPAIVKFEELEEALPIGGDERQKFQAFVFAAMESYAATWARQVEYYYKQFGLNTPSLGTYLIAMDDLLLVDHPLRRFLDTVREHTRLDYGETGSEYFGPLRRKLDRFTFVETLLSQEPQAAELVKFQDILQQIVDKLRREPTGEGGLPNAGPPQQPNLYDTLSPEGRIAFDILGETEGSYRTIVQAWLRSVGIAEEWQKPFLSPVEQIALLGRKDIEQKLLLHWETVLVPQLVPLLARYPFQKDADQLVAYDDLERLLQPKSGRVWLDFNRLLLPACIDLQGTYHTRFIGLNHVPLPENMLSIMNQLRTLSHKLWDENQAPKPLTVHVKPRLLPPPPVDEEKAAVVMSFLNCGEQKVYGFNQTPEWQPLTVEWWRVQPSSVGIQLRDPENGETFTRNLAVPEEIWSFFRLLDSGTNQGGQVWSFYIRAASNREQGSAVEFETKEDPWKPFQVETP